MNIRETIAELKRLAEEPELTSADLGDDLATAEYLCLTCEPALSGPAVQQLMRNFLAWRDQAEQRELRALIAEHGLGPEGSR